MINFDSINKSFEHIIQNVVEWFPELIAALIIIIIGIWLIRIIKKRIKKLPFWSNYDPSISTFTITSINIVLYIILFVSAATMIGIPTTSMIAILGSVGIAIGLALQSHLSNIAAGVEILILKPIKSGDFVLINGFTGTVKKTAFFFTYLNTVDNRLVIIPNNDVVNNPLVNYSAEQFRKLDVKIGISYNSSIIKAKELIKNILSKDERILNEPETPLIVVDELGTSSVILLVRAWINSDQLLDLKYDFLESVKTEFDKAGIIIPYPQTDIHLYEHRTD